MIYRTAILLSGSNDRADDALGAAIGGLDVDVESASGVRFPGGEVSLVLRFAADDDDQARALAQAAARAAGRGGSTAHGQVESLSVGRGRSHRRVAL